jgi:hypothetical protein
METSFVVVKSEMPAFVFDDPAKDLGENRVRRSLCEQPIALQRRKFLDRAPSEVCG